ncbi:MAG: radical SAM protein [bacterium]|nr:radical SAM protein [bacterium]
MPENYTKILKKEDRDLFELLPGYACNANCRFCSIDPAKRNVNNSTKELLKTIYDAKKDGFKYLGIGGGEPTIRKDLQFLINFAKQLKFDIVRIETNGIALSRPDYCKHLVESGLDFVKISIHSRKAKIHDYLVNVPGAFKNILKAIENLQKLKVRIEINTVINKYNYKEYPQFVDFFSQMGIGSFCFIYPLYTGRMADNWREVGINIKKAAPYLEETFNLIDELELDKGIVFNIPPCCLSGHEDKMVESSPFNTKVGAPDITVESIDFDRIKNKTKLKRCQRCRYFQNCEGVWNSYSNLFGDSEFQPIYEKPK